MLRYATPLCALFLSAMASPLWAQFSWQTTHTTNGGYNSGMAELVRNDLFVAVHPGYVDVEEEVEIAANGAVTATNDPNTLEITGDFSLPTDATVVGLLLWDGDVVLQAKLLSKSHADSLYQAQVDRNSTPPVRPRDPVLLSLTSPGNYHFSIYPVRVNESRRFRLRYHLPPQIGVKGLSVPFIPAFAAKMGDKKVTVHLSGADGVDTITWVQQDIPKRVDLPRNLFVTGNQLSRSESYQSYQCCDMYGGYYWGTSPGSTGVEIQPKDPLYEAMYATSLPAGQMQGNYMHLYSQVPDSALSLAGMRVEIAVYWKWHNPQVWSSTNSSNYYYSYLNQVEAQAQQLVNLYSLVQPQGAAIGLIHSDGRNPARVFPMARKNELAFDQARDYLSQWNYQSTSAFASKVANEFKQKPTTAKERSQYLTHAFQGDIRLVASLFSKTENVVRHIVLLSAGPAGDLQDLGDMNAVLKEELKGIPASIGQMFGQNFEYPGLDLFRAKTDFPMPSLRLDNSVAELPRLPNFTTTAILRNEANAYDLDLKCVGGLGLACDAAIWHGKSMTPWSHQIDWEVHDSKGRALFTYQHTLSTHIRENDTALAVLWAGSTAPFSENREPPLGPVYGFVDPTASLLALEKDSLTTTGKETLPNGSVPRIANADLLDVIPNYNAPINPDPSNPNGPWVTDVLRQAMANSAGWHVRLGASGLLEMHIPGLKGWQGEIQLQIVSLAGRVEWSGKANVDALGWLSIPIPNLRTGMHWVKLASHGQLGAKTLLAP